MWQRHPEIRGGSSAKFVVKARWPEGEPVDASLRRDDLFFQDTAKKLKASVTSFLKKKKGKTAADFTLELFVQLTYSDWQVTVLDYLKNVYETNPEELQKKTLNKGLQQHLAAQGMAKKAMGPALGFATYVMKREFPANGVAALESVCPINQLETLEQNAAYLTRVLGVAKLNINVVGQEGCYDAKKEAAAAKPGAPSAKFV